MINNTTTTAIITIAELCEGHEVRGGIVTDIIPNERAGEGYLDVYVDDAWAATLPPHYRVKVYA